MRRMWAGLGEGGSRLTVTRETQASRQTKAERGRGWLGTACLSEEHRTDTQQGSVMPDVCVGCGAGF